MKKLFNRKGMTLVEVLIATAVLALVVVGVLGIVQSGVFVSAQSTRAMIADVTAQQLVEELVGRELDEIEDEINNQSGTTSDGISYTRVWSVYPAPATGEIPIPNLVQITVTILDGAGGDPIHTLTAVLNVKPITPPATTTTP